MLLFKTTHYTVFLSFFSPLFYSAASFMGISSSAVFSNEGETLSLAVEIKPWKGFLE